MNFTIANERLTVVVSSKGGELQSVKSSDGTEYLWQGDVNTWPDRAINIFPYVARLTEGSYDYKRTRYHMEPHGFLPSSEMELFSQEAGKLVLKLSASDKTKEMYPFTFTYFLHYELIENRIRITFEVRNQDDKTMYFGIGGHPGFIIPLEEGLEFEDYFLEFSSESAPVRIGFSETCFRNGNDKPYDLKDGTKIPLAHSLFDDDAIVLKDMCHEVTLKSLKGEKAVKVTYPDMDYLGLWHWPKAEVNYVCIEPWASLPSRDGIIEDLEKQEDLISLESGNTYENTWFIEII